MDRADPQIRPTPNIIISRVRKDYTPLHVYLGSVWVVIHVKYITYEGLLHNTLAHLTLTPSKKRLVGPIHQARV